MPQPTYLLRRWLAEAAPEEGVAWLEEKREGIARGAPDYVFFSAFSGVPRHTGKADLRLSEEDVQEAHAARAGWQPGHWSVDQAGRTLLVLSLPAQETDRYEQVLDRVFTHADVGESVALYQSLPLLPRPEHHRARAAEGLRTNMTSVFNAVALRNPYPAEQLSEAAWNQMVLKAVFVGSPLHLMQGPDERANPELARMLVDYAHERWAAGRSVTPELWRPVGPFADEAIVDDLKKVLAGDAVEQQAAALALSRSPSAEADRVLSGHPKLQAAVEEGYLTWERLCE